MEERNKEKETERQGKLRNMLNATWVNSIDFQPIISPSNVWKLPTQKIADYFILDFRGHKIVLILICKVYIKKTQVLFNCSYCWLDITTATHIKLIYNLFSTKQILIKNFQRTTTVKTIIIL